MRKKSKDEDQIKLEPIAGIRPGVYLTAIYSFILLVILFFLLILPGLKNNGAMVVVKTEPQGAAVRIDGVYMGVSGSRIFVPKGTHTIETVLPGFNSESAVHQIPGRVFGSLFFPRLYPVTFTLKPPDPVSAFTLYAADFAEWSFMGEPTSAWQIPLILSEGAYRTGPANDPAMQEILLAASRFTVTRAGLRDLLRAKILMDNSGLSPSPAGLLGSISDILSFLSENPGSAEWLSGLLPSKYAEAIGASAWSNEYKTDRFTFSGLGITVPAARRLELSGLRFTGISEGYIGGGRGTLHRMLSIRRVKAFMISENPVPRSLFETFLNENPEWREHKTDYFPEQLYSYPAETFPRDVITGVTWFAAEAFCKWLTTRLPASMAGMEARLPAEIELELAGIAYGVGNMPGSGWEWCADPFAPLQFITASPEAVQAVGSPERNIRGRPSSAAEQARSSLPPELSSPFVSFRPVIAERDK